MKWTKIEPGRHTLSLEIDGLRYSLLVRSRWYEFLLPFNISLLGHEVGRYQAPLEIHKNNSNYYFTGYGLASILSALLVTHTVTLNLFLMNLFKILLYLVGLILVVFWFNRKKKKWHRINLNTLNAPLPVIYLIPGIKAVIIVILGTAFNLIVSYFMLIDSSNVVTDDWRIFFAMPLYGAFMGLIGLFSIVPVKQLYRIRKIKYQGREITVPELEQIIKNLETQ
ncbi:hypothetical protein [Latilactobacillus graminis]|uniref:DUF443 domain-containing protein n=1 Tax=Latilactobacillus graminis TaxID=60519 RepID=A0ABX6C796_9LACO|nr:hypothetical protein [Latilactobacillus graminis]QFP79493.1 DUF443 domain-containing protein [Latilactobacillus graminis]